MKRNVEQGIKFGIYTGKNVRKGRYCRIICDMYKFKHTWRYGIMKFKMKKMAATAMAVAMCVPCVVSAAETKGNFDTSFDIYSPVLTVSVPTTLDIRVNPLADTTSTADKSVGKFAIASNSIDIINGSVDVAADKAIPVNATIQATIASKGENVTTEYNTFTASDTSAVKKVFLTLSEANTPAVIEAGAGNANAAWDSDKHLDLSKYAVKTAAEYDAVTNKATVTKYGSLLSVDIAGPSTTDTTPGAAFSTTASKVTPVVGSFAITGVVNANADWKSTDLTVNVTYDIRASKARTLTTPTVAAVTFTSGTSATDLNISVTGVGEATVTAMALHNDSEYGDFPFETAQYTVDYATAGTAKITLKKDDAVLAFLAGDDFKGKAQDLVIALSDGRIVTTTLTVN